MTLEGHDIPILAFKNLHAGYSQMLIGISRNLVIEWDLLKSSVNLTDYLYVNMSLQTPFDLYIKATLYQNQSQQKRIIFLFKQTLKNNSQ
ncbi:hypothetical protein TTHERM_000777133 (macronuclear) [Tetrahymena thermophila SB210]|uniref:Uncharacterized protein n=1 Tax=Tetrahymena thermophila (strain SB210) TaxID=312017 RepID=W7X6V2_TETTS|nr:hypothetical protein TTHERM_000777133 [Tetrahymena thermophila SB210]EWS73097.1 hypothetical protein TTHERM_000777133 [Tetrahymena thermophila SB210]|eukprot:XP_012654368.1 hypothetical protein TTHERM_000777133 [Tetrahymena thermophila SB210]